MRRTLYPGDFVPIYERNGMICQLDFFVFEQVCKDIRDWLDRGMEPVRISMNFSRKHLSNPNLPDDFGTGYSSLNLLRSFPVDVLKIDKSFIDTQEENDRIVLSNIIHMANQLHMNVIAEGVETVAQMEFLRQMNCKVVQGYLFDRPMQRELFEQRLLNKKYDLEK